MGLDISIPNQLSLQRNREQKIKLFYYSGDVMSFLGSFREES